MNGAKGIIDASHNEGIAVADTPSPPSPEILEKLRQLREELAQKAAQQAPKDANTLAWQQSNAFKRVYPRAEGGVIDMDRMRLELMNKRGLSKQERDANLSKFLENSVVSNPMYHSTVNDFNTFGKTKDIGYHFGSKHVANERLKDVTSSRPKGEESISGANVMPVHLNIKQPIYVKNDPGFWSPLKFLKEPFWKIDTTVSRKEYNDLSELGKSSQANAEEEEARIKADRNIKRLPSNERTELLSKHHKPFWDEARRLLMRDGFDGLEYVNTYEGQGKNKIERRKNPDNTTYVAFHPHQIKSAIGNRGTYDTTNPDITKAKGGITHAHHLDIEERPL